MRKTLTALAVSTAMMLAAVAAPQPAEARGGRVAGAIIGGLAAGAIIGGLAARGYYYGPGYYYDYGAPYYAGPPYYYGPPAVVYEAPPVYVAPRPYYRGYSGQTHGGYYYGPVDQCWPCY
jgi:hypothetical protein